MENNKDFVLIVDDDDEIRMLLKAYLEDEGYFVEAAGSGAEALKVSEKNMPDLILADVLMDGIDGIEFLKKIKKVDKSVPVILMSAYGSQDKVIEGLELGAVDFISKPFLAKTIADTVRMALERKRLPKDKTGGSYEHEYSPMRKLLRESYASILKSLVMVLESKDPYIREHSMRVAKYASMLAKEVGMKPEEVDTIEKTGYFHDIGKVGITDAILQKPGRLTKEEFDEIKRHPQISYDIVAPLKLLHVALAGIKHHHERWDGGGYPDGLKEEGIPLTARIMAVADTYEALTSDRPYRKGKNNQEAVAELLKCSGKQFDPKLVKHFIRALKKNGEI